VFVSGRRRVVISGRGAVSGFGAGRELLAQRVWAGASAVRPRERTAGYAVPSSVAAEVPAACLADTPDTTDPGGRAGSAFRADTAHADVAGRAAWVLALARRAAREALREAGDPDPGGIALVLASTKADLSGVVGEGEGEGLPARLALRLAAELGLSGVCAAVSTACASGLVALSLAARRIERGEAERLLVVGVDALSPFVMAGFGALHALDPGPCRPFDVRRRGISLGEAAGAILLSAHERESVGVVLAGYGGGNDAAHAIHPDQDGAGLALATRRALSHAGLAPADMDLIHLHGTGTLANDASEAAGLGAVYGGRTSAAFGSKAQTGHTLGAAGVIETLLAVEALQRGVVPANIGLEEQGVDGRLDLVREARPLARARRALKVAGGFGGIQAALVLQA
jgi:3-oxoacyl-(acyl-carrier-protein) synthase